MHTYLRSIVFVLLIIAFCCSNSFALKSSSRKKLHHLYYKTKNGRIDYDTVCSTYSKYSEDYRECRKKAKKAFSNLCREHRKLYREAEKTADKKKYKKSRDKYCAASYDYRP